MSKRLTDLRIDKWQKRLIRAADTIENVKKEADAYYATTRGTDFAFIQDVRSNTKLAHHVTMLAATKMNKRLGVTNEQQTNS